ncbi:MAG: hypothetical protein DMG30_27995 [Acidobacteria bacterium]|nr:MAG: hypothetical protein DMG30_27995 [Acidobacteriota bacterium]
MTGRNDFFFALWIFFPGRAYPTAKNRADTSSPVSYLGIPLDTDSFLCCALAMTVNLWLYRPVRFSIGLGIILLGVPFYFHWRKKSDVTVSPDNSLKGRPLP